MTLRRPLFLQSISQDPDYAGMVRDHARRHQTYCARHGYAYLALPNPEVTFNGFFRLRMVLEQMQTGLYSHVWWVDADVFVADLSRDMRETTPAGAWLGMTIHPYPWGPEVFHLQCGMFYFRCTPRAEAFIKQVLAFEFSGEDDQAVINRLMLHDEFSPMWQKGLYILDSAWNNTLHDQPNRPIVAAFHGYLSPAERRVEMARVATLYPFTEDMPMPKQKVILNMIERNESAVLMRSLTSFRKLAPHFDLSYVIGDGGSSDDSKDIIKATMDSIPGVTLADVQPDPIEDFSRHRNTVLQFTRGATFPKPDDLILFLDADDELVVEDWFHGDPPLLDQAYEIMFKAGGLTYWRTALVRADLPWRYVEKKHELLTLDGEAYPVTRLMGMHILVHAGEGARSKGAKAELDAESLQSEIERDPNNPRTQFYLAQSLRDSGDIEGAMAAYAKRAEMGEGTNDEEVYISLLERARLLAGPHGGETHYPTIEAAFLAAWMSRPTRAEALGSLAVYCLNSSRPIQAATFALIAAGISKPQMDRLFIEEDWYDWKALEVFAEASYEAENFQAAQETYIDLLVSPGLPENRRDSVRARLSRANAGRWSQK